MGEVINIIGRGVTDPHIHVFDGRAYLYASHDHAASNDCFDMRDWQVWSSDDLLEWNLDSTLRPQDTYVGKPTRGCWATDVVEKDGRYFWFFSVVTPEAREIGMVRGDSPTGPWVDILGKPFLANRCVDTEVYDPCLFQDDDGEIFILFGVWDYYIARLSDDLLSLAETPRKIEIINPQGPYGRGKTDDKVFLHKRSGLYYLSWGAYYATSTNVDGPYRYRGCIVDPEHMEERFRSSTWPHGPTQGRHGSFFEWNGRWHFTYCEMCFSGNRYFRDFWISHLDYDADGSMLPIRINSKSIG